MEECKLCKEKESDTRLEDNTSICWGCYTKVFNHIFKGQFTLQEGESTLKFLDDYNEVVNKYVYTIMSKKLDYKEIRDEEERLCMDFFKKNRECVTKQEYLYILAATREKYSLLYSTDMHVGNVEEHKHKHLLGCSYLEG